MDAIMSEMIHIAWYLKNKVLPVYLAKQTT